MSKEHEFTNVIDEAGMVDVLSRVINKHGLRELLKKHEDFVGDLYAVVRYTQEVGITAVVRQNAVIRDFTLRTGEYSKYKETDLVLSDAEKTVREAGEYNLPFSEEVENDALR